MRALCRMCPLCRKFPPRMCPRRARITDSIALCRALRSIANESRSRDEKLVARDVSMHSKRGSRHD